MKRNSKTAAQIRSIVTRRILASLKENRAPKRQYAERLMVSQRYYYDLERGKYECGMLTLLFFLLFVCPDPSRWLDEVRSEILAILQSDDEWFPHPNMPDAKSNRSV